VAAAAGAVVRDHGSAVLVWRYDPIVLTRELDAAWHQRHFRYLAERLAGLTDECIVSFVHDYPYALRGLEAACAAEGDVLTEPDLAAKLELLASLAAIAHEHRMRLSTCAQPGLSVEYVRPAHCVDVERLGRVAGWAINAKRAPRRKGCGCARSIDIGVYGTCRHGCVYCYARRDPRLLTHDPEGEALVPIGAAVPPAGEASVRSRSLPLFPGEH
jgi:hypothetical protein